MPRKKSGTRAHSTTTGRFIPKKTAKRQPKTSVWKRIWPRLRKRT